MTATVLKRYVYVKNKKYVVLGWWIWCFLNLEM